MRTDADRQQPHYNISSYTAYRGLKLTDELNEIPIFLAQLEFLLNMEFEVSHK